MEQAGKQKETKYTITSSDTTKIQEFDHKRTLFKKMTKTKSFNKNTKYKALYHDLMESILKDEDAIDKVVADRLKKRNPDDADRDEGPPARPDQWLKRNKMSKDTKPSKKAKSTGTSKGTTNPQPKSTSKSAQVDETVFKARDTQVPQDLGEDMGNTDKPPVVKADPKDWFKKLEKPPTPDPEWNECKNSKLTHVTPLFLHIAAEANLGYYFMDTTIIIIENDSKEISTLRGQENLGIKIRTCRGDVERLWSDKDGLWYSTTILSSLWRFLWGDLAAATLSISQRRRCGFFSKPRKSISSLSLLGKLLWIIEVLVIEVIKCKGKLKMGYFVRKGVTSSSEVG
ncbi:hypothetical protein Tco_0736773 [Tanacetum coccineum]